MHIGIDARIYGIRHRGIGRYTEQLVSHLSEIKDDNRYTLFMLPEDAEKARLREGKVTVVKTNIPHYSAREHLLMPKLIKSARVDVMHFTHLNAPLWCPVPYVVTIHDLIVHHFPDTRASNLPKWKYLLKVWGYNKVLKNAISGSEKIIAVSEFTKRDLSRSFGVDEKKIQVTYLGAEKLARGFEKMRNTEQFSRFLFDKYGVSYGYILYVGSAYPHKNLDKLIQAHKILREKYMRDWQLVLAGREDSFYKSLRNRAGEDENYTVFTGEVPQKDLDGLYRGAKLFVFPSLYEGFGLPVLEAASRAIPCAISRVASLPEIMSDSAAYFNPKDPEAIARTIDEVGGSGKIQDYLSQKGFERASHFSWEETAKRTVDVYSSIMV